MQKFLCSLVMIHPGSGIYALFIFTEPVGHFPESADAVGGLVPNCSHGDVSPEGINKADAIFFLLDYLGAQKEDTVAFGDEAVDVPMFELCGYYSVAMGSGNQSAKDAADYITTGTDDDGLWNAFEHLGLL